METSVGKCCYSRVEYSGTNVSTLQGTPSSAESVLSADIFLLPVLAPFLYLGAVANRLEVIVLALLRSESRETVRIRTFLATWDSIFHLATDRFLIIFPVRGGMVVLMGCSQGVL